MASLKRQFRFYFFLFGLASLIAVWGLNLNIKTEALNVSIRELSVEISTVKQQNRDLQLEILSQLSLEKMEKIASEDVKMAVPKRLKYLRVN